MITFIILNLLIVIGAFGAGYGVRALTSGPRVRIYRRPRQSYAARWDNPWDKPRRSR